MKERPTFYVKKRMILMCDFGRMGFIAPEMTKHRRVVVLRVFGPTALIVPLSATQPQLIRTHHAVIEPSLYQSITVRVWVKGDALTHVSLTRLGRVNIRLRSPERLNYQDFRRVLVSVSHATGVNGLTRVTD